METKKKCPYCGSWDVQTVYVESEGYRDWCPQCGKSRISRAVIKSGIIIFIIILVYILGNIILYYAQESIQKPNILKCEQIEIKLKEMELNISKYEKDILNNKNEMQSQKSEIEKIHGKLLSPEINYKDEKGYNMEYNRYRNLIKNYNNNVDKTNKLLLSYKVLIDSYNSNVEEYNKLAKTAYTRWFIIPMPTKSKVKK